MGTPKPFPFTVRGTCHLVENPGCPFAGTQGMLTLLVAVQAMVLSPCSFTAKGLSVLQGEGAEPKLGNSLFLLLWHEDWVVL